MPPTSRAKKERAGRLHPKNVTAVLHNWVERLDKPYATFAEKTAIAQVTNLTPEARNLEAESRKPKPYIRNPEPEPRSQNPKPYIRNLEPGTRHTIREARNVQP